jgi:hypothetical protein
MGDLYCDIIGQPTYLSAVGTAATSGDNTLVAAPGAAKSILLFYVKVQNESATKTTAIVKHGSVNKERVLLPGEGDYFIREFKEPRLLPANTALVLNLSGANSHGYTVDYLIV